MKKSTKIRLIITAVVLAVILSFAAVYAYFHLFLKTEVYRETSPDYEHEFIFYQVGEPDWPFGPVKAQIVVVDAAGETVDRESIIVHTDGAALSEYCIREFEWSDTTLTIECTGEEEGTTRKYTLVLE